MTDKQIIIDGVDVSGCEHFSVYSSNGCRAYFLENEDTVVGCENYPNCYYKQLKHKEQECEELDKELHKNFEEKDKLHLIIDRLLEASGYDTNTATAEDFEDVYKNMRYEKQQLDQLKSENEELKKQNNQLDNGINEQFSKIVELEGRNNLLKAILAEIKEIVHFNKTNRLSGGACISIEQILQKINEVEDVSSES